MANWATRWPTSQLSPTVSLSNQQLSRTPVVGHALQARATGAPRQLPLRAREAIQVDAEEVRDAATQNPEVPDGVIRHHPEHPLLPYKEWHAESVQHTSEAQKKEACLAQGLVEI